jgi:hypothetical protein
MHKVNLTIEERRTYSMALDELELAQLDPTQLEKYRERQRELVYGENYKTDAHGNPIEQGVASPHRQTSQHLEALERERKKGSLNTRVLEGLTATSLDSDATALLLADAVAAPADPAAEIARLKRRIASLEAAPSTEPASE